MRSIFLLIFIALSLNLNAQYCPLEPFFVVKLKVENTKGESLEGLEAFLIDNAKSKCNLEKQPSEEVENHYIKPGLWRVKWNDDLVWKKNGEKPSHYTEGAYISHFGVIRQPEDPQFHNERDHPLIINIPEQMNKGVLYTEYRLVINAYKCRHLCPGLDINDTRNYDGEALRIVLTPK
jgi:hypothetical protein